MSVAEKYAGDPLNPAFASDLTNLIDRRQPDLWIHGHTHTSFDYSIGATRIVCNPKGYGPHQRSRQPEPVENPEFDVFKVVDVPVRKHDDDERDDETPGSDWRI